ncbi:hypothetical protein [Haloferax sp. Atlit-19N]|uniref:hypothetical protein n=1 Tax=Haloferax sp. Atlit-19N TaxID=2077201 RepID=UPI0011C04E2B|nr:hypothetical protein [Haloferax sp. Atlit-19N]
MSENQKGVVLECERPLTGFDPMMYQFSEHHFGNAIVVPESVFDELGVSPHSYVRVRPDADPDSDETILYAVPFDPYTGPEEHVAAVRTNLMKKIHPEFGSGDCIRVKPVDAPSFGPLTVQRAYSDYERFGCYLAPTIFEQIGCEPGDEVEVFNPLTGGRAITEAKELLKKDRSDSKIRLELSLVELLDIQFGDKVKVRKPVQISTKSKTVLSRLASFCRAISARALESLVGSRKVNLRVVPGEDQDEERGVVRIRESTTRYLGVEVTDTVKIGWKGTQHYSQCLRPSPDYNSSKSDSLNGFGIAIPSSIRDRLEVSPNDVVSVRRNTWLVFQKQISVSIIGILGVVFGTFQIANTTRWMQVLISQFGRVYTILLLLTLSAVISLPVIYLLFLPVRSQV